MDRHVFDSVRLARSPRIGPVTFRQLVARYGDAGAALRMVPELAERAGGRPFVAADEQKTADEIALVERLGARHLILDDDDYPPLLAEADDAPPVLIVRGDGALASARSVAIVGARNASAAACRFARGLALDLCAEGVVVVSGLARGIDTAAHLGALGGKGGTIGVIASGIDIAYPPENAALQEQVAREGLLIAEQPPGTQPLARHFPHRNRIIAGLCRAVVVVEAAPRSGSLITARMAGEYGREVLAVPGSPLDSRAQGCNLLIREGATLVQNAADVIEAIDRIDPRNARPARPCVEDRSDEPHRDEACDPATVDALLGEVPVAVDELVRQSALPSAAVQSALLELEIAGRIERHAGGKVALAAGRP